MTSTISPKQAMSGENKSPASRPYQASAPARRSSESLLQGASVLEVEHNGQIYRLQKTALNKLILTK